MTPTVLAITATYFIFEWLLALGSIDNVVFDSHFNLLAMLPAGIVGGIQFAATRGHGLRWPQRLLIALYGNLGIVIAPFAVGLFFSIPMYLLGFGVSGLLNLPAILAFASLTVALSFLISFLFAIPTLFVGFTLGQWLQFRRMARSTR